MEEITLKYRTLFLIGAAFNAFVSTSMMVPEMVFPMIGISPIPEPSIYVHLSSSAIGCFGVAYFMASQDFPRNANLIELGIQGKIGVNVLAVVHVFFLETMSWHIFLVTGWDLILAYLFAMALLDLYKLEKSQKKKD